MSRPLAVISDCAPIRGDERLLAGGWTRRYLADADRAEEASALYRELGFEVLLRAPRPDHVRDECDGCRETACRDYVMVYTRRRTDHE